MDFEFTDKVKDLQARVSAFMEAHVYPNEEAITAEIDRNGTEKGDRWQPSQIIEDLKKKAKAEGLWNLFLPESERGGGLTNLEYAPLCEIMGRVEYAPEIFNCSAPDTGNMEVLERYGTEEHKKQWLKPLLDGEIRSAFAMTEPKVASSDATNIECRIEPRGRRICHQRPEMVDLRDRRPALQDPDPDGQDRSGQPRPLSPAVDDPGAARCRPASRCAACCRCSAIDDAPHGHGEVELQRCPGAGLQHAAGRRSRLRDRAGPPRPGPHPSLHAADRPGGAGAGEDVPQDPRPASPSASRSPSRR